MRNIGAPQFMPGSHAIGLRKFVNIFFGEPEDILADPEIAGRLVGEVRGQHQLAAARGGEEVALSDEARPRMARSRAVVEAAMRAFAAAYAASVP